MVNKCVLKIKRIKDYNEISWLKNMPVALSNKYWLELTEDLINVIDLDYELVDQNQTPAGKVTNIDYETNMFLCELYIPVNYTHLLSSGIPIENIVFDLGYNFVLGKNDNSDRKKTQII